VFHEDGRDIVNSGFTLTLADSAQRVVRILRFCGKGREGVIMSKKTGVCFNRKKGGRKRVIRKNIAHIIITGKGRYKKGKGRFHRTKTRGGRKKRGGAEESQLSLTPIHLTVLVSLLRQKKFEKIAADRQGLPQGRLQPSFPR